MLTRRIALVFLAHAKRVRRGSSASPLLPASHGDFHAHAHAHAECHGDPDCKEAAYNSCKSHP